MNERLNEIHVICSQIILLNHCYRLGDGRFRYFLQLNCSIFSMLWHFIANYTIRYVFLLVRAVRLPILRISISFELWSIAVSLYHISVFL